MKQEQSNVRARRSTILPFSDTASLAKLAGIPRTLALRNISALALNGQFLSERLIAFAESGNEGMYAYLIWAFAYAKWCEFEF